MSSACGYQCEALPGAEVASWPSCAPSYADLRFDNGTKIAYDIEVYNIPKPKVIAVKDVKHSMASGRIEDPWHTPLWLGLFKSPNHKSGSGPTKAGERWTYAGKDSVEKK